MTYIVSDIHGRADRYYNILKQIQFSESDTLYILGDVIDRNPDGIQILLEVMEAKNILMILGNHEYMMDNVIRDLIEEKDYTEDLAVWYLNGGEVTLQSFLALHEDDQKQIVDYIETLPLNREITVNGQEYLLIHGSPESTYNPDDSNYPDVTYYAVWNRHDPFQENAFVDKTIVCGHTPTIYFSRKNPMEVFQYGNTICMDCGCAFRDGRLACLCIETGEIIYSDRTL